MKSVCVLFPDQENLSEFLNDIKSPNLEVKKDSLLIKFDFDETLVEVAQNVFSAKILD